MHLVDQSNDHPSRKVKQASPFPGKRSSQSFLLPFFHFARVIISRNFEAKIMAGEASPDVFAFLSIWRRNGVEKTSLLMSQRDERRRVSTPLRWVTPGTTLAAPWKGGEKGKRNEKAKGTTASWFCPNCSSSRSRQTRRQMGFHQLESSLIIKCTELNGK